MTLDGLKIGQKALIKTVGGEGFLRQHLLDMGLIPGTEIRVLKKAPMGDPIEVLVCGYTLSLRLSESVLIGVVESVDSPAQEPVSDEDDSSYNVFLHEHYSHPGLGEEGKYHSKTGDNPLPKGSALSFALVGQQNSGKTTFFNRITGSGQHVGNFPGVTVERIDGSILKYPDSVVTDLPGIYSLSPYSTEELVSREFILKEKPNCIINIVDANNLARNLYLTVQLLQLDTPMVLGLNMMDEVRRNGGSIRVNQLEEYLGIPVVPISADRNEGIDELLEHARHIALHREKPKRQDFCSSTEGGGAVHRCIHGIMHLVEDHAQKADIPLRFATEKLIEGDRLISEALQLSPNENEMIEHIILQMEDERGLDRTASIAEMRYAFVNDLCKSTVVRPRRNVGYALSTKIDSILTGKWTALPIFIVIMSAILWLSIDVFGLFLQDILRSGINYIRDAVDLSFERMDVNQTVRSLVSEGIFNGVGAVVSFVPIIIVLFFFLSLVEDSGYMARIAFVTDKVLRKIGLSGQSIVPMLIGLGCTVPAVMATRTLPSAKARFKTVLLTPFISCSAKIPIYVFLISQFFPRHGGLIMVGLYFLSISLGILILVFGKILGKSSEAAPFVLELPNYRLPRLSNIRHLLMDMTKDFLQRAFTIILLATIVIWFLQSFNFRLELVEDQKSSILAWIAGLLAPVFNPLGLGDWRIITSLISGFLAKENVVSSMEILDVLPSLTTITAIPMLLFSLLYTPCIAAISSISKELGRCWALFIVVFQCVVAWIVALIGYNIALLFV